LDAPLGENGFGYDPIFWDPQLKQSAAQVPAELKNRISHRGRALAALQAKLAADA
jgi:XTP/dITP diphosphohydrolase